MTIFTSSIRRWLVGSTRWPERIDPQTGQHGYDIKSDVWSFGITMIEIASGRFPYSSSPTPFEQLKQVVKDPPPKLPPGQFTPEFEDFLAQCLRKSVPDRANYLELMAHLFLVTSETQDVNMPQYVTSVLDRFIASGDGATSQ